MSNLPVSPDFHTEKDQEPQPWQTQHCQVHWLFSDQLWQGICVWVIGYKPLWLLEEERLCPYASEWHQNHHLPGMNTAPSDGKQSSEHSVFGFCRFLLTLYFQMATAFQALRENKLIHTDVHLENIMMVNHKLRPFEVKLIDFGLAISRLDARPGLTVQPLIFRYGRLFFNYYTGVS